MSPNFETGDRVFGLLRGRGTVVWLGASPDYDYVWIRWDNEEAPLRYAVVPNVNDIEALSVVERLAELAEGHR